MALLDGEGVFESRHKKALRGMFFPGKALLFRTQRQDALLIDRRLVCDRKIVQIRKNRL